MQCKDAKCSAMIQSTVHVDYIITIIGSTQRVKILYITWQREYIKGNMNKEMKFAALFSHPSSMLRDLMKTLRICTHTHAHAHRHTHMHTRTHAHTHTYTHSCTMYMCMYLHTNRHCLGVHCLKVRCTLYIDLASSQYKYKFSCISVVMPQQPVCKREKSGEVRLDDKK